MTIALLEKGKGRALPENNEEQIEPAEKEDARSDSGLDSSDSESDSSSSSSTSDDEEDEISQEFLDSLLEQARRNLSAKPQPTPSTSAEEEEIIHLGSSEDTTVYVYNPAF